MYSLTLLHSWNYQSSCSYRLEIILKFLCLMMCLFTLEKTSILISLSWEWWNFIFTVIEPATKQNILISSKIHWNLPSYFNVVHYYSFIFSTIYWLHSLDWTLSLCQALLSTESMCVCVCVLLAQWTRILRGFYTLPEVHRTLKERSEDSELG